MNHRVSARVQGCLVPILLAGAAVSAFAQLPAAPTPPIVKPPPIVKRVVEIPVGAIVIFPDRCPADGNWEPYAPAVGRFLVGAGMEKGRLTIPPGESADLIDHNHGGSTGAGPPSRRTDNAKSDPATSDAGHTHEIDWAVHLPPYLGVVFCILK